MTMETRCPYCGEEILAIAIKCKHCGSNLATPAPELVGVKPSVDLGWALLGIPMGGAVLLWGWVSGLALIQGPGSAASLIVVGVVIGTATLAAIEASKLGMKANRSEGTYSPTQWMFIVLFMWVIGYPAYLFKRRRYGRSNLLIPAIAVAFVFLGSAATMTMAVDAKMSEMQGSLDKLRNLVQPPATQLSAPEAQPQSIPDTTNSVAADAQVVQHNDSNAIRKSNRLAYFDTWAYCRKLYTAAGGSYQIEEACRTEEATAQAALSARTITAEIESYCRKIGQAAGGSYQIMNACVDEEVAAKSRL